MNEVKGEIAKKGEILRILYLIERLFKEMREEVVDGVDVKKVFSDIIEKFNEKFNQIIPLIERELPEWAKERARETFNIRSGFVIWEPQEKLKELNDGMKKN